VCEYFKREHYPMTAIYVESVPSHFYQNQKEWQYRYESFDGPEFPASQRI